MKSILILALSFVLFSCSKSPENKDASEQQPITNAGAIHNAILDQLAASPSFSKGNQQEGFRVIAQFMEKQMGANLYIDYIKPYTNRKKQTGKTQNILCGSYDGQIRALLSSSLTASAFSVNIIKVEDRIRKDVGLSDVKEQVYLNTLSILKSSYMYWEAARDNPSHPWHSIYMNMRQQYQQAKAMESGSGGCGFDPYCIAAIDAVAYSDTYWYLYSGSNHDYASNQAYAQSAYSSGVAAGYGMELP